MEGKGPEPTNPELFAAIPKPKRIAPRPIAVGKPPSFVS